MKIDVKFTPGNARPSGPPRDLFLVKFSEIDDKMRVSILSGLDHGNLYLAFSESSFSEFMDKCASEWWYHSSYKAPRTKKRRKK